MTSSRSGPGEFAVAAVTATTVVVAGVEQGIVLAMFLSILEHIYHSYRPHDTLIVRDDRGEVRSAAVGLPGSPAEEIEPGLILYRFGSGIYYANGTRFTSEIMDLAEDANPPLKWLGLVGSAIGDIDYSGADSLRVVQQELSAKGTTLVLVDISDPVRKQLDAYGLTERIGRANFHNTIEDALDAYRKAIGGVLTGPSPAGSGGPRPVQSANANRSPGLSIGMTTSGARRSAAAWNRRPGSLNRSGRTKRMPTGQSVPQWMAIAVLGRIRVSAWAARSGSMWPPRRFGPQPPTGSRARSIVEASAAISGYRSVSPAK